MRCATNIVGLVAAGVVFLSCVKESSRLSDDLVSVGTHQLQIHREGIGSPVVVVDAGLADELKKVEPVEKPLSKVTEVVTYNRAGYGRSEPGPLPRDCEREARELKRLLEKAEVRGPYVLVGHSLGALNMQVFASMYPDEVAGLILLDPPPIPFLRGEAFRGLWQMAQQMTASWEAMADSGESSSDPRTKAQSTFFRMIASEHRELFGRSAKRAGEISSFGQIPLIVIQSGKANPAFGDAAGDFQRFWVEQSRVLTQKSANGLFVLVPDASHDLWNKAPKLVAENILSVVQDVRRGH